MKFNRYLLIGLLAASAALVGCTENVRSRAWGGNMTVNLPPNQKLVNVTWKTTEGSSLWYLTRPMHSNECAETFTFQEKSSFGMMEGAVKFVESKQ